MRRFLPAFLFLVAVGPFVLAGCGDLIAKLKGGGEDAGSDAAAVVAAPDAAPAATDTGTATAAGTAPPLTTATTTAGGGAKPVVKTDGGVVADAGAVKTDAAAPAPTPTLTVPPFFDAGGLIKAFDAGGFKPPFVK